MTPAKPTNTLLSALKELLSEDPEPSWVAWEQKTRDALAKTGRPLMREIWEECPEITDELSLDEYVDILIQRWKEDRSNE